jgi:hypothetical protein
MKMKKFDQTTFSDHAKGQYGDCVRACVYTLLGEDIGLVHPIDLKGLWNYEFFMELVEKTGKDLNFARNESKSWPNLVIRAGMSPRGISHAVVWDREKNEMYHDPHPTRVGLSSFDGWYVLR